MIHMVDMTFDELVAVPKPFPASTKEFRLSNNEITEVGIVCLCGEPCEIKHK